jgi:hypothetical protein
MDVVIKGRSSQTLHFATYSTLELGYLSCNQESEAISISKKILLSCVDEMTGLTAIKTYFVPKKCSC